MLVPVTYAGPRQVLELSWTTDGLRFEQGKETLVPDALIPLLKGLPGHGFRVAAPASVEVGAVALEPVPVEPEPIPEAPAPEPLETEAPAVEAPAAEDEPADTPEDEAQPVRRKPGRKPKEQ